ncbi:MAG: hypothetical protein DBX39_03050 [Bacillota bacterium]|nr:MAG: hypothetical protein DBX39_03050 [Bacillota bacterium]
MVCGGTWCGMSCVRGHGKAVDEIFGRLPYYMWIASAGGLIFFKMFGLKKGKAQAGVQFFGKSTVVRFETEKRERGTR